MSITKSKSKSQIDSVKPRRLINMVNLPTAVPGNCPVALDNHLVAAAAAAAVAVAANL